MILASYFLFFNGKIY